MKKIFIIVALASASVFSACNNKAKQEKADLETQKEVARVKDSIRLDSFNKATVKAQKASDLAASQSVQSSRSSGGAATSTNYGGTTTQAAKKQGWSDAAKGATIGGLAGAVGGAIIDKKKGRGAIIGGVLGAGTGYVIGREKDKKSGRVQPKNN